MSDHPHLPPTYFEGLRSHLPPRTRSALLAFQLARTSRTSRDVLEAWLDTHASTPDPEERLLRGICGTTPADDELAATRREAAELVRLPDEELAPTLWRAQTRFRSPALVAVLLARSRERIAGCSEEAAALARVAATAAEHMARPDLQALALAYAANARRADGWLDEADALLGQALERRSVLPEASPPWLSAEIDSLHGSLLKDHRHLAAAGQRLHAAILGFQNVGDSAAVARVRMKLAAVHRLADLPAQALPELRATLVELEPFADLSLFLRVLHNLALYLSDAGEPGKARDLLDLLAPLYERFPATRVRRQWLAGVVARALKDTVTAERQLRSALARFVESGSAFYAALVALDLSELLLAEGRTAEVAAVTRHLPALFEQLDVRPEAAAAVLLFHKAAARNDLDRRLLSRLREFFERAQVDRSVRFSPPAA